MIIDTHIHCFPDKIANKAAKKLIKCAGIPTYTDFTEKDTRKKLNKWEINLGIVLPIATKPDHQRSANDWAISIMKNNLIAFGTIHPDSPDALEELDFIAENGLKGVKMHPDYQNFFVDDKKLYPIYKKISELKLPIVFHVGYDPISPDITHATPRMVQRLAKDFPELNIIAAHLGGLYLGEECEQWLVGLPNVYFDLAMTDEKRSDNEIARIICNHGASKILYASDCPWCHPHAILERLKRVPLTKNEYENILWRNAASLLRLDISKI